MIRGNKKKKKKKWKKDLIERSMSARRRVKSLDEIWPDLESGLTQLFTNLNEGFPRERWMRLYT
jgi:hypothetical protein